VAQAAAETQNSKAAGENPGQTVRQVAKDQGEAAGQQAVNDRQQQNDNGRQQSANGQKDNPAGQSMNPARQSAQRDPGSNQPFMEKDAYNTDNAKKAFTDKLRGDDGAAVRDASGVKAGNKAADAARTLVAEHAGHGTEAKAKAESAWEKISAPKVMKQVTDAAFKNLGQGKKQLTLNLKPEELGAVRVILQVDGKEVNATLRAESAEAAKVISDNVEMLKQSLENQGLKVNKLDVQTGLADNSSQQNWHGEQQHNLAREREAMSRMRERMRNLRSADGNLARNMQNMNTTANTADQGLHVVA
jgi:flagellar hook-length control protein FliK